MKRLMIALTGVGMVSAASAALYTNSWSAAEGVTPQRNWNEASNWSVSYAEGTPEPASAVPTADSFTKIQKSGSIALQAGDDLHSGTAWLLAGVTSRDLALTIPTGAKLSLDGVNNWTALGTPVYTGVPGKYDGTTWDSGSINNHLTIDIVGGELVFGQSLMGMRGPLDQVPDTLSNVIRVGDGGTFSVTNGVVWFGSRAGNNGEGGYSNVIEVAKGGTLQVTGPSYLQFGGNYDGPSSAGNSPTYNGGGWINVCGGTLDFTGCTSTRALQMSTAADATVGGNLIVTDGGCANFGGKTISVCALGKNLIRVAGGSVLTNADLGVQKGGTSTKYDSRLEIDKGEIRLGELSFGKDTAASTGRLTILVRGPESALRIGSIGSYIGTYYEGSGLAPWFLDCRLTAHAPRGVRFPMTPLLLTKEIWNGNAGARSIHGINRLSPDGGLQLVHAKSFPMVLRNGNDQDGDFTFANSYRLVGDEMWTNTVGLVLDAAGKKDVTDLVGFEYGRVYYHQLKDEAKLTDGVALETPRPRAWLPLPRFTAKQVNPLKTERVSVRLQLVAPESGTLDLDGIVAKMCAEGGQQAYADDSVAGYNVRVDLPMDELAADTADDSIVMDFVQIDNYLQANGTLPCQTNALIRAATCECVKIPIGGVLIFR